MIYFNAVSCADSEIKNWNTNVKVSNYHDVIITSKWRQKVVKLLAGNPGKWKPGKLYCDYFIMRYLNAVSCADSEIKNWNTNVKVSNYHDVIITSKWRHKVVKLRCSVKYSDYFIMSYLNAVSCADSEIKNWITNVKVSNYHEVIMTSKWRPNDVIKS